MNSIYTNLSDLKKEAKELGFEVSRPAEDRVLVFGPLGASLFIRWFNGEWKKSTYKGGSLK